LFTNTIAQGKRKWFDPVLITDWKTDGIVKGIAFSGKFNEITFSKIKVA